MDSGAMDGYLLLADISGYTAFLTGTELEHSHAIITELTKLIRARLVPPMRFVKLEGDAVLCFAGADAFPDGEQLLELVESCYFDFTGRLLDMTRSTTCTCDACRAIDGLDLKFVVHRGTFIVDRDDDGRIDLAGPDVILAHRLLKNTVIESGGPAAYGLFTERCFAHCSHEITLPSHTESYDSFGDVAAVVQDLAAVAAQRRDAQRIRVSSEEADLELVRVYDAPPSVLWQYYVQPDRRAEWSMSVDETSISFAPNDEGRLGAGATSHCAHGASGDALREYLDWRPYEYFTCRMTPMPPYLFGGEIRWIETFSFTDLGDGRTEYRWTVRCLDRSEESMAMFNSFKTAFEAVTSVPPSTPTALAVALDAGAGVFGLDQVDD
jgi:uncharacterized protein YndB with AHSA1/START domain